MKPADKAIVRMVSKLRGRNESKPTNLFDSTLYGCSVITLLRMRCPSDSMVSARANTIVVADDFAPFRRFLRLALQENGFQNVAEASDGLEAVAKAAELQPDLVG